MDTLSAFRSAPARTRAFLAVRWWFTPYAKMARALPMDGDFIDLACGHGLFALHLAAHRPGCQVVGVDHDANRTRIALSAAKQMPNLRFLNERIERFEFGSGLAGISIIDSIHYLEKHAQKELLNRAHASLRDGGVLLVREIDPGDGMRGRWTRWYEEFAVRSALTRVRSRRCAYRPPAEWIDLLREVGFTVTSIRCGSPLLSDHLFVATKTGEARGARPLFVRC